MLNERIVLDTIKHLHGLSCLVTAQANLLFQPLEAKRGGSEHEFWKSHGLCNEIVEELILDNMSKNHAALGVGCVRGSRIRGRKSEQGRIRVKTGESQGKRP
jgi:hypothetical protein